MQAGWRCAAVGDRRGPRIGREIAAHGGANHITHRAAESRARSLLSLSLAIWRAGFADYDYGVSDYVGGVLIFCTCCIYVVVECVQQIYALAVLLRVAEMCQKTVCRAPISFFF